MTTRHDPSVQARLLVRAWLGGLVGAAAMTALTAVQRRVRGELDHPVDYDASRHVVDAVARVLGREPASTTQRRAYFALAHWGYGSAVAMAYPVLATALRGRARGAVSFYAGCQSMAVVLLPSLGGAPAPRTWPRDVVANSLVQHAVYAAAVVAVTGRAAPGRPAAVLDASG